MYFCRPIPGLIVLIMPIADAYDDVYLAKQAPMFQCTAAEVISRVGKPMIYKSINTYILDK